MSEPGIAVRGYLGAAQAVRVLENKRTMIGSAKDRRGIRVDISLSPSMSQKQDRINRVEVGSR